MTDASGRKVSRPGSYKEVSWRTEDGNHTEEQHEAMSVWNGRLQKLMEKERAGNL